MITSIFLAAATFGRSGYIWGANTTSLGAWSLLIFANISVNLYFPEQIFSDGWRKWFVNILAAGAVGLSFLAIITDWVLYPSAWAAGVQAYNNFLSVGLTVNWLIILSYFLSLIVGITLLLGSHLRFRHIDPDLARKTRIVIWGTALGIAPLVLFSFLPFVFTGETVLAPTYGFLFFLIIPLAYAYAIFQENLIRVDFAINRAVVFFVLALAILGGGFLLFVILVRYFNITEATFPLLGGSFALLVAVACWA